MKNMLIHELDSEKFRNDVALCFCNDIFSNEIKSIVLKLLKINFILAVNLIFKITPDSTLLDYKIRIVLNPLLYLFSKSFIHF